ncbi:MAG TPA: hypothetical protein VN371_05305 [Chlorobaculum sp.]|nr:hypothetical protein [Chlorobaculum sp.]
MNGRFDIGRLFRIAALLVFSLGMTAVAQAENFMAAYNRVQQGVTVRTLAHLLQVAVIPTTHPVNGIAAGPNNDFYAVCRNHIYNYSVSGALIRDMNFPDPGINYTDVSVRGDRVYASFNGSQQGFTVRDLALNQLAYVPTNFSINSIAAGAHDDLYLASGNRLFHYAADGTLLKTMTFPDPGIIYTNVAVTADRLLAAYSGSQHGFTIRDLNTLEQYSHVTTPFDISGIVAGSAADLYLSSTNHLYNYTLSGVQKQSFTWPQTDLYYGDLTR